MVSNSIGRQISRQVSNSVHGASSGFPYAVGSDRLITYQSIAVTIATKWRKNEKHAKNFCQCGTKHATRAHKYLM